MPAQIRLRCDASRSMRAPHPGRPHPSRRAHARSTLRKRLRMRAPQDEDSIAFQPISRCQTAHLVPAAHVCARGFATLLHSPRMRGGRSAEKRSGACEAPVRRIMTRYARRLAVNFREVVHSVRTGNADVAKPQRFAEDRMDTHKNARLTP